MKPQLTEKNVFPAVPNGSNVTSSSDSFASQTPADLDRALQEDRDNIQKEIVLRRKEQVIIKRRPVPIELRNESSKDYSDCREEILKVKEEEQPEMDKLEGFPCHISDSGKLSVGVTSRREFTRNVTNLETIDDLSVTYARVIRG